MKHVGWSRRRPSRRSALTLVVMAIATGCAGTTRIGTILDDPSAFDGEVVRVEGEVTQTLAVPLVGGTYSVNDGTGTLRVVTDEGGVPRDGAALRVVGIFRQFFAVGAETLAVLQERDREVR